MGKPKPDYTEEKEKTCTVCGEYYLTIKASRKYCSIVCERQGRLDYSRRYHSTRQPAYLKTRFEVFKRDGFKCVYCGRDVSDGVKLVADHIYPRAKGGLYTMDNLVTACEDCNLGKSDILLHAQGGLE